MTMRYLFVVVIASLALATGASARAYHLQNALSALAGRTLALNCTYAARGGTAEAFPSGGPTSNLPTIFAKPWVCNEARAFAKRPDAADAPGLLVLTHESLHIRVWSGEFDAEAVECEALREVTRLATMLGSPASLLPQIEANARAYHKTVWSFTC